jgi:hypothetical protein
MLSAAKHLKLSLIPFATLRVTKGDNQDQTEPLEGLVLTVLTGCKRGQKKNSSRGY